MASSLDPSASKGGAGDSSQPSTATVLPPLLGSLSEICIVTPDHKKTIDGLARLGIGPFQVFHLNSSTCRDMLFRGQPDDFDIIACFAKQGDMVVELMQPVSGASVMQEYLDRNGGREGLQHVAWDMGAKKSTLERVNVMEERGVKVAMRGTWVGKQGTCQFTFFDTEDLIGTTFETIEFSTDWEDPDCEWYPHRPAIGTAGSET